MKAGSFQNMMAGEAKYPKPESGMGATVVMWTDRYACTIIDIDKDEKTITIQFDKATRTDKNGMSESQSYSYKQDPNGQTIIFTKRKGDRWVKKGQSLHDGVRLAIGARNHYYDYSF